MQHTILLDVDGVLADFLGVFLKIASDACERTFTKEDVTDWNLFKILPEDRRDLIKGVTCEKGFCEKLPIIEGSHDGLKVLRNFGDVYAVTSPWDDSESWCHERTKWLAKHLDFNPRDVIYAHKKSLVKGDVLIDDNASTVFEWVAKNPEGFGLIWDAPYNRKLEESDRIRRVFNWKDVSLVLSFVLKDGSF
jgi:5'(3')-deoxyribonucleotidase